MGDGVGKVGDKVGNGLNGGGRLFGHPLPVQSNDFDLDGSI